MAAIPIKFGKSEKQTVLLITFLFAIAAILYFYFMLLPQLGRVSAAFMRTAKARVDLASAKGGIARIGSLKNELMELRDKMGRYDKMLPSEQPISSLLESLSAMARESNVKIAAITPLAVKEDKARESHRVYEEVPILISAKSGYHELGNFLARLEGADRFMKIADIEIKSNSATPKRHDVDLLVLTYKLVKGK